VVIVQPGPVAMPILRCSYGWLAGHTCACI
jgi:hypothetical protein